MKKKVQMDYHTVIKMLRVKHNMTQEECAKVINITTLAYRNKELGKADFKFSEIDQLFDYWKEDDLNVLRV